MKKRHVELYVGEGGDSGTWWTEYVEIPADTPDDKIGEVAIETFKTEDTVGSFSFCGVYAIPDLDDEINEDEERVCVVTNIEYDTDGEEIDLPKELRIEIPDDMDDDEIDDYVSDEISNITGFCHKGFSTSMDE